MSDFDSIVNALDRDLSNMARGVIREYLDMENAANQYFLEEPDAREQHQTRWHQWGILTHSRVFLRHFEDEVPAYLREWGLWDEVLTALKACINGYTKWQLLHITILLHDFGKFAARTEGKDRFHFWRHEELSGNIVRSGIDLASFGLHPEQVEYVARTAEDHFVLGVMRNRARAMGNYDAEFVRSQEFVDLACEIKRTHPDDYIEIGVLFLGDSLAKTDPSSKAGPPDAADQYGINVHVAHKYLDVVLGNND